MTSTRSFPIGWLALLSPLASGQVHEDFKLVASDGESFDYFGQEVAIYGDRALVYANHDEPPSFNLGAAYLFDTTTGEEVAKLTASDGMDSHDFGCGLAIDSNWAVICARTPNHAYVFDARTGQELGKLVTSDGGRLGCAVAIDDHFAIIADHLSDPRGIYVFDLFTGTELGKFPEPPGASGQSFGRDLDISGDLALVSSHSPGGDGSAYVFDRTSAQVIAELKPGTTQMGDNFGWSVAINGNRALVGAPDRHESSLTTGVAYVFDVHTGQLLLELQPSDGVHDGQFGSSVALGEHLAIIGASYDDAGADRSGAAYVFDAVTGRQLVKLTASDGGTWEFMGRSVAFNNGRTVVGAERAESSKGAAYLYEDLIPWTRSPVNGHWYRTLSVATSWQEAEDRAQAFGGHLATLRGQVENNWLTANLRLAEPHWIGYHDSAVEGQFVWSSGETPSYENWLSGQPDDANGADWAVLTPVTGKWTDEAGDPSRPALVELISDDCDGNDLPDLYEIAIEPTLDWNGDGVLDACTPSYCPGELNSTGVRAEISAWGSPTPVRNRFLLQARFLPPHEFAYFMASESTAFVPNFGGSTGNLCIGAPQYRFNVAAGGGQILNSGSNGLVSFTLDLTHLPQGISFDPGETWYFQLWYRDFTTGPTSNTSNGLEVLFR